MSEREMRGFEVTRLEHESVRYLY